MRADRTNDITWLRPMLVRFPAMARKPQLVVDAARAARIEVLELLKERGADLNASWRGYRALHALMQEKPHGEGDERPADRLRCLAWLLANGADPEQLGAWPPARAVIIAAFTGMPTYVERLLAAGVRRDTFVASALADVAAVRRDLKRDSRIASSRDAGGLTPLQCCALWLLDNGADPNLPDARGWTAVHQAASRGNERIFRALVAARGDVARKDREGRTPLHVASLKKRRKAGATAP